MREKCGPKFGILCRTESKGSSPSQPPRLLLEGRSINRPTSNSAKWLHAFGSIAFGLPQTERAGRPTERWPIALAPTGQIGLSPATESSHCPEAELRLRKALAGLLSFHGFVLTRASGSGRYFHCRGNRPLRGLRQKHIR